MNHIRKYIVEAATDYLKVPESQKQRMISKAMKMYGKIFPIKHLGVFEKAFTLGARGIVQFWFDKANGSSTMITEPKIKK